MASTPEEFLREGFLVNPETCSPSLFLDLPPTPHGHADAEEDPASSDDLVLPYIFRVLMEEDIDDKFFHQYPDHPALLTAQQRYAQILSSSSSHSATNSGNSTALSPSSSSPDAPANPNVGLGLADNVDNLFLPGYVAPSAAFQQSPPLYKGAADGGNSYFAGAGQNGGGTGIQSSAFLNGMDEEGAKSIITLPAGDGDQGALASAFFNGHTDGNIDMLNLAFLKGMEEFLREGFLVNPEPFSPTPHGHTDAEEDPASSDDLIVPYISRMLMEEDIDDKFFHQYPDHPALLTAQQRYAQILSSSSSHSATNTTTNSGNSTALSPSSSSPDAPSSANPTRPYDPIEPYPNVGLGLADNVDNLFLPGYVAPSAAFQQSPPLYKGAADGGNSYFAGAGQNGGGTGIQSSAFLNGMDEEGAKSVITLPAGDGDQGALASAFFNGHTDGNIDMLNLAFLKRMEEFLREGFLINPEPFSPTPHGHTDADADLPYISRMLMDHPALLTAQQRYAQIPSSSSFHSATNTTTNSGNSTALSHSSSSPGAPAPAPANPTWPYVPIKLSQLLQSPPYPDVGLGLADNVDNLFLPGDVAPSAGFQQSPPLYDVNNSYFAGASQNGGGTGIQSSAFLNGTDEEEAKTIITLPAADGDQGVLASVFFNGQTDGNIDMLNLAFLKGMEEAKKFLPTNNTLLVDLEATSEKFLPRDSKAVSAFTVGRAKKEEVVDGTLMFGGSAGNGKGRRNRHDGDDLEAETGRNSKLMMLEREENGAREMFDEIMLRGEDIIMKGMEDLRIAMANKAEKKSRKGTRKAARGSRGAIEVVDLRTLLIHCSQAVATGDRRSANELLKQIKQHSSPRGDATQRLAHCFAEGLEARLAGTGSQVYQSLMVKHTSVVETLKAYKLCMAASCFRKVNFAFSFKNIYNAVAGRSRLHIVDYGMQYVFQWPVLLNWLAAREGGPPEVRFTGIDLPQPGFRPAFQIEETGRRLSNCARELGVPFRFHGIAAKWETIRGEDLNIDPDEVLVVNSQCSFSKLMDESVVTDSPCPRDVVLSNIRKMRPDVFIQCVVNSTYGAPFFVTRFREALFFYVTIPRESDDRLLIERDMLGLCAVNVIACEGADRVFRPETYKQWQLRNHRAGLRQLPLNPEVLQFVRDKVENHYHKDFVIDVDHRWLLQGWKGRVLYAMSTWIAEDTNSIF